MDTLRLKGLELSTVIGTLPGERVRKQNVVFDLALDFDSSKAGKSDDLADTFDYSALERKIVSAVESSSFRLIEALAEHVAGLCLEVPQIRSVEVTLSKPEAEIRSSAVEITVRRSR